MSFPSTGEISMETIRNALSLGSGQISMSDLYGKRLYYTNGSIYTLPSSGEIDISNFRGKFYTPPVIAPVDVLYTSPTNTEITITIPTGKTRLPSSFDVTLYGGGGAGGGGGGAATGFAPNSRSGAGGGGGGSGGKNVSTGITYSSQTIKIYVGGGAPRVNGGSQSVSGTGGNGTNGTKGSDSYISINAITQATAVGGNGGTGGQGGKSTVAQGQPGGSGGTGSTNGNVGSSGSDGVNGSISVTGGNGGAGGSSVDATGYGKGGNGGRGGSVSGTPFPGYYTSIQADNALYNSEAGTDGAVKITWYYDS
jgi:hypothetical protein